jgi:NADH-quinone oxidoreductase subunit F
LTEEFLVGKANVYGAVSFYDFLRPENQGKKVYVCNGSACLTAGTQGKLEARLANHFAASEVGEMCCLGRCHENSAFYYDRKNYSGSAIEQIADIKSNKRWLRTSITSLQQAPAYLRPQRTSRNTTPFSKLPVQNA